MCTRTEHSTLQKLTKEYLHEVHDHVELLAGLERVVQTHDEGVAHVCQDCALSLRALHLKYYMLYNYTIKEYYMKIKKS